MTRRSIGALAAVSLLGLLSTTSALAHAELVESDPPDGGTIEAPFTLTATYSEELLDGSSIVIDNAAEEEVARGEVEPDNPTTMVVELPALAPGEYLARSTAKTADGHTERNTFSFTVAARATPSATATSRPTATGSLASQPATTPAPAITPAPATTPAPTSTPVPGSMPEIAPNQTGSETILVLLVGLVVIGALLLFLRGRR